MKDKGYFEFAKYGSIGLSWVLTTTIYTYLGFKAGTYLDARWGSAPIFLLIGLLSAMALSMRSLINEILSIIHRDKEDSKSDQDNRSAPHASDREKSNKKSPRR